jgi:UDP-galactose transporter B1
MFSSNFALHFISYPTQALVKACKILPVMIVGLVRKTYDHPVIKYVCGVLMTVGLVIFNVAKFGKKDADSIDINYVGGFWLIVSLLFDGLVGTQSDIEKARGNKTHAFHLMVSNNLVGLLFSVALMIFNYVEIQHELTIENIKDLAIIGFSGAIGQIFIFLTITKFDCFLLTTVTTSRKFFSLLISIIVFSHPMNQIHWFGITIVFTAIGLDVITSD